MVDGSRFARISFSGAYIMGAFTFDVTSRSDRPRVGFWPRPRSAFLAEAEAEEWIFEVDRGRGRPRGVILAEVDHCLNLAPLNYFYTYPEKSDDTANSRQFWSTSENNWASTTKIKNLTAIQSKMECLGDFNENDPYISIYISIRVLASTQGRPRTKNN